MTLSRGGDNAVAQLELELGRQVRALRKAQGLTQQQLADRANSALGAVKNLESGRGATTRTLARVLRALHHESWLTTLRPPESAFNPLDVPGLAQRHRQRRAEGSSDGV